MRSQATKLLSGVSALAVITALSLAGPASAASVTGPLPSDAFINDGTANNVTDFVAITADATLDVDANNDSFFNNLTMLNAAGPVLTVDDSFLLGDIVNQGSMTASTGNAIDILNDSQIDGGIFNGVGDTITGAGYGISITGASTVGQGIHNDGTISGTTGGIFLGLNSEIYGGIDNTGTITGGSGIVMSGAAVELRGGITNHEGALIEGTAGDAILFDSVGGFLRGGITNDGHIQGQGASNNAISLAAGTVNGGITNSATGVIDITGTTAAAIFVNGTAFNGSIDNSGDILAETAGGVAINIAGTTVFTGSIVNQSTGTISASSDAIIVAATTFIGNITNSGGIVSLSADAIVFSGTTFTGNITNNASGIITANSNGIVLSGTTFAGDVLNAGAITAGSDGIVANAATMAGVDITNSGTITADDDGIFVADTRTLGGAIVNSLMIEGDADAGGTGAGINIQGQVTGGITNTGTIKSATTGIDVTGADAATVINQNGGLIQGRDGAVIETALDLVNAHQDTVNANGGAIDGDIIGNNTDDVVMGPTGTGTFAYLRGTASGLDTFNMTGSGTAILGANARGANTLATAPGVTIGAVSMTHSGAGTLYVDDNTQVNLTGAYTQTNGILEFQLTSDVTTHGQIVANTAALGGRIAAYIQGDTFGSIGGDTFTYQDVITGTIAGNFTNFADIDVNSIFFTGVADVNAADVDIILTRQSFTNALALPGLSQNQLAVGGAIEAIYSAGGYSTEFEDLFNYILSLPAGHEEEVAHIYDELSGAEHADLQEVGLRVSHTFNDMIGGRFADIRTGEHMAELGLRRYADAAPPNVANDGMSAPRLRDSLGMAVWGRGYGAWTEADGDAEAAGYDQDTGGFAGGLDFAVDTVWRVGGAIGWSSTSVDFDTAGDTADVDSFQFAGYGSWEGQRLYADAALSFGFHDISSTRLIELGPDTAVASANYDANTFGAHGEFGARFEMGTFDFEAFVGAAYGSQSTDGFAESGADGFSLLVQESDADSLATSVGARFSGNWQAGGVRLIPKAEIAWRHEFMDERQEFQAAFLEDPATQFQIVSTALSRDSAVVGLGLGAQVSKGLVLFLDYDGLFNGTTNTHAASAGLRATW
ncbi:MAG: autotransporter domain-containing protein [Alphaproteobacteria bacterium]|nr:autotransporter domain-containing protein [Alphaproteobacteria bacterium]